MVGGWRFWDVCLSAVSVWAGEGRESIYLVLLA